MKRTLSLFILGSLALSACAPVATGVKTVQKTQANYTITDGRFVLINDAVPANGIVLALDGVMTEDSRCKTDIDKITTCRLGDLAANASSIGVPYSGIILNGSVTWRVADGSPRGLLILPDIQSFYSY